MPRVEKSHRRLTHDRMIFEKITLLDRDFDKPEDGELACRQWRERIDQQLERET